MCVCVCVRACVYVCIFCMSVGESSCYLFKRFKKKIKLHLFKSSKALKRKSYFMYSKDLNSCGTLLSRKCSAALAGLGSYEFGYSSMKYVEVKTSTKK